MKLLLDEQISGKVADRLRARGHDVIAVVDERPLRGFRDSDLFEFAQEQRRAVVTYDRADFEAVIRRYAGMSRPHLGLIIVPAASIPSWEFARLAKALDAFLNRPDPGSSFVIWLKS